MDNQNHRIGWVIFSLFVWLHLIDSIYPLPTQRVIEIESSADVIASLKLSYWLLWFGNFLFLFFGLLSTYLLYQNSRSWPIVLGIVSMLSLIITIPPIFEMSSENGTFSEYFSSWLRITEEAAFNPFRPRALYFIYYLFLWPLFPAVLLGLSINTLFNRRVENIS